MLKRAYFCFLLTLACGSLKVASILIDIETLIDALLASSSALSGTFLIWGLRRRP